ncbi:hypothetical protein BKA93DRAFT_824664 [Sparassis latifolia]|uniref:Yeast cell wall synthesis Kre9/Knh1-like N-terminal domain-containing protein n=1 Tax=Sparassis crispa TaxID=139825 RepID=A0A401GCV3_9APHY|nr:hypothetical protein SCP_0212180 [Sparassis crispa]GBE80016.1 hypothetical protein SCP_0212180 [Sparassis crispa]
MRSSFATLLAFAASAFALQVTSPTNSTGWSTSGNNTVSWVSVSTDPANFTIVLVNENEYPTYSQVLDALVVSSLGSVSVGAPSGGWVAGAGYQVNLVQDATRLDAVLAQSGDFTLQQSTSSSSSGSSSSSSGSTLSVPTSSGTNSGQSTGSGSSGTLNPTSSDSSTNPTTTSGAAPAMGMQAVLFAALALLGVTLA